MLYVFHHFGDVRHTHAYSSKWRKNIEGINWKLFTHSVRNELLKDRKSWHKLQFTARAKSK